MPYSSAPDSLICRLGATTDTVFLLCLYVGWLCLCIVLNSGVHINWLNVFPKVRHALGAPLTTRAVGTFVPPQPSTHTCTYRDVNTHIPLLIRMFCRIAHSVRDVHPSLLSPQRSYGLVGHGVFLREKRRSDGLRYDAGGREGQMDLSAVFVYRVHI